MNFKVFVFNSFQVNMMVCSNETRECVFIDAACQTPGEQQELLNYVQQHELIPKALINTHGHIDHVIGNEFVTSTWNIPFYIHRDDLQLLGQVPCYAEMFGFGSPKLPEPAGFLNDNDVFRFGTTEFQVIHIPGHSAGGVAFYARKEGILFAGDVLFRGSVGRSDLPGGDHNLLIQSIRDRLFVLPGATIVWPGHGPSTTIEYEQQTNPYLQ